MHIDNQTAFNDLRNLEKEHVLCITGFNENPDTFSLEHFATKKINQKNNSFFGPM